MFNNKFTKKDSVAEEIEKIISERWDDDDEDDDVKRADAELRRMKAKPIEADKKTDPDKEIGKLAKKTPKEVDESAEKKGSWEVIGKWKKMKKKSDSQAMSSAHNLAGKALKKTKEMKKEEVEQIDELSKSTLAKYMRANTKRMADPKNPDSMERKMKRHDDYFKASKKFHEDAEQIDERNIFDKFKSRQRLKSAKYDEQDWQKDLAKGGLRDKTSEKKVRRIDQKLNKEELDLSEKTLTPAESKKKEEIVKSMKKDKAGLKARYGKRWKEVAYATATKSAKRVAEEVVQESYGDMSHAAKELVLHADNHPHLYHSSHTPIMNNLKKKMKKGEYHPEKAKKLWAYHADRAAQSYAKEHGDGKPWHKMFSTSDRKAAASHWEDMHRHELNEAKGPTADYGLETFATNPTNESTPLNKAKIVAKAALSKIKNEMLGKAGATSEEIDPRIKTSDTLKGRVKTNRDDDVGPSSVGRSHKVKFTPGPK